jgi:hypothetical protein
VTFHKRKRTPFSSLCLVYLLIHFFLPSFWVPFLSSMLTYSEHIATTSADAASHSQPQSPASPHPSPSPLIHPYDHTKLTSDCQVINLPSPPSQEPQKIPFQVISQSPPTLYQQLPSPTQYLNTLSSYHEQELQQQEDESSKWHHWHNLPSSYIRKPSFSISHIELLDTLGKYLG